MRHGDLSLLSPRLSVGDRLTSSTGRLSAARRRRIISRYALKKFAGFGALAAFLLGKQLSQRVRRNVFAPKPHVTEDDVRRAIDGYLAGRLSLAQLDTWLLETTWDAGPALAHKAELLIAEADRGDRPELASDLHALTSHVRGYTRVHA